MVSETGTARAQPPARIVIATRQSALALWQARHVQARLSGLYPRVTVEILGLTTEGDRRLSVSLAAIGGKGLFVRELEEAIGAGRADMAVNRKRRAHGAPDGYLLSAMLEREDRAMRSCRTAIGISPR